MTARMHAMDFDINPLAWIGNGFSLTAILGAMAGWFPPIAAFAAFVYYCLVIYRDPTVQGWLHTRRVRKIAALKKLQARLEAQEMKAAARLKHGGLHDSQ